MSLVNKTRGTSTVDMLMIMSYPEPNTGCWIWAHDSVTGGYGRAWDRENKKKKLAHRLSYELFVGPIPEGLTVDHLCKNPHCINPQHLEPVTMKVNTMRGSSFSAINAAKTHCPQGHEYNTENTFKHRDGRRECRTCMKIRKKKQYDPIRKKKIA